MQRFRDVLRIVVVGAHVVRTEHHQVVVDTPLLPIVPQGAVRPSLKPLREDAIEVLMPLAVQAKRLFLFV